MTRWLRIALAAQVAFFALWGAYLLTSHEHATVVWLATDPVDPRDLLSGHYVALHYRISSPEVAGCSVTVGAPPTTVYVQLETGGETVTTGEGRIAISRAVQCRTQRPDSSSGSGWVAGQLGWRNEQIAYGIERFYVAETSALRVARSGSVVAKVAINDDLQARLVDVVPLLPSD